MPSLSQSLPSTLLCLREAAKLLPSTRPGRCINIQTLARWCQTGKIRAVKRNGFWFVRPEDLDAIHRPFTPVQIEPQRRTVPAHVLAKLREMGAI